MATSAYFNLCYAAVCKCNVFTFTPSSFGSIIIHNVAAGSSLTSPTTRNLGTHSLFLLYKWTNIKQLPAAAPWYQGNISTLVTASGTAQWRNKASILTPKWVELCLTVRQCPFILYGSVNDAQCEAAASLNYETAKNTQSRTHTHTQSLFHWVMGATDHADVDAGFASLNRVGVYGATEHVFHCWRLCGRDFSPPHVPMVTIDQTQSFRSFLSWYLDACVLWPAAARLRQWYPPMGLTHIIRPPLCLQAGSGRSQHVIQQPLV